MEKMNTIPFKKRAASLIAAGALVASMAAMAPATALADQTGTGQTDVYVQINDSERGGTEYDSDTSPYYNPDEDGDGLGDNLAFTVPVEIDFVADSHGVLTGPSAEATYIENESAFAIHGSSLDVDAVNGWNIVADASAASAANSIDFQAGPSADMQDAYAHLEKADMTDKTQWNMTSHKDDYAKTADTAIDSSKTYYERNVDATNGAITFDEVETPDVANIASYYEPTGNVDLSDRVQMASAGDINNVTQEITNKTKVAEMHWYVTPGTYAEAAISVEWADGWGYGRFADSAADWMVDRTEAAARATFVTQMGGLISDPAGAGAAFQYTAEGAAASAKQWYEAFAASDLGRANPEKLETCFSVTQS